MDKNEDAISKLKTIVNEIEARVEGSKSTNEFGFTIIEKHPTAGKLDLEPVDFVKEAEKLDISKELKMLGLTDEVDEDRAYLILKYGLYRVLTGSWPGEE